MITGLIVSSVIGLMAIAGVEILRVQRLVSNEASRKTLHIAHGLVVVAWAIIANYTFIIMAEILFLVVVLLARQFRIMQPLRNVNRKSWGEIFFGLGIMITALLAPSKEVFIAAVLHLALADAFAALVGRRFKKGEYFIFGQRKTIAGSSTFFIVSLLIIIGLMQFGSVDYQLGGLLVIPVAATLAENFSPYGSDNLTISVVVLGLLGILA